MRTKAFDAIRCSIIGLLSLSVAPTLLSLSACLSRFQRQVTSPPHYDVCSPPPLVVVSVAPNPGPFPQYRGSVLQSHYCCFYYSIDPLSRFSTRIFSIATK